MKYSLNYSKFDFRSVSVTDASNGFDFDESVATYVYLIKWLRANDSFTHSWYLGWILLAFIYIWVLYHFSDRMIDGDFLLAFWFYNYNTF